MSDKPHKKSFYLYTDMLDCLDMMDDTPIADLFRMIKAYHNGTFDEIEHPDPVALAIFPLFKNQFDRDQEKYEKTCNANRINGLKGGRPKKSKGEEETQITHSVKSETQEKPSEAKKPDTDKDTDIDINKNNRSNDFDRFWKIYPKKVKKKEVLKKWKARKLDRIVDVMIADVENRIKNDERWKQGFIPDPTTYINGDRWDDELTKTTTEKGEAVNWWDTADGIKQKGEEFGITESRFDSFPAFKNAVFQEAKNRQCRRIVDNAEIAG